MEGKIGTRDNRLVKIVYMRRKQTERDRGGDPERDGARISLLLMNDSMTVRKHYHKYTMSFIFHVCVYCTCFLLGYLLLRR